MEENEYLVMLANFTCYVVFFLDVNAGIMRGFFFRKLCTIFWRIVRPKFRIMLKLCELRNIFKQKILIVLIY